MKTYEKTIYDWKITKDEEWDSMLCLDINFKYYGVCVCVCARNYENLSEDSRPQEVRYKRNMKQEW
jgi:hypothetical protein